MLLHRTTSAFQTCGVRAKLETSRPEVPTLIITKYHATAFINNFFSKLPYLLVAVGGTGYKATLVALGYHSLCVHPVPRTKKWDTCAPDAILQSVGGGVVDMHGQSYVYTQDVERTNIHGICLSKTPELTEFVCERFAEYIEKLAYEESDEP
jgi:3'(2'), 5'-bisphosphate nucleotidase